jgi:hypothetical protein
MLANSWFPSENKTTTRCFTKLNFGSKPYINKNAKTASYSQSIRQGLSAHLCLRLHDHSYILGRTQLDFVLVTNIYKILTMIACSLITTSLMPTFSICVYKRQ